MANTSIKQTPFLNAEVHGDSRSVWIAGMPQSPNSGDQRTLLPTGHVDTETRVSSGATGLHVLDDLLNLEEKKIRFNNCLIKMHSDVPRLFSSHSWDDPVGLRDLLELTVLKTGLSRGTGSPAVPSLRVAVCDGSPGRRAAHRGRRSLAFLLLYVLLRSRPEASHVPRPLTVGSDHSRSPRTWPPARGPMPPSRSASDSGHGHELCRFLPLRFVLPW